uniref:ATP synthase F0 subunit 8 n=1 Tax=Acrobeloides nanus TaxID=290746 RepID=A0A914DTT5_9BILA
MGMQTFAFVDYLAPICVFLIFWTTIFVLCVIFNYLFITRIDDLTVFEKLGRKWNIRLGPHTMSQIRHTGAWTSTIEYHKELRMNPMSKKRRRSIVSMELNLISATQVIRSLAVAHVPEESNLL